MRPPDRIFRRIHIVGTSGSGKSTLARRLSGELGIPYIELDAVNWQADWTERSSEDFVQEAATALQKNSWVVDGNYESIRDLLWENAEVVIWLNYPFRTVFFRVLGRSIRRIARRESLWAGNQETIGRSFFSRHSILLWVLKTYKKRKRTYRDLLGERRYADLLVIEVPSPAQLESLIAPIFPR